MALGYTSLPLIKAVLANSLMSKTSPTLDVVGEVLSIGNELDANLVNSSLVETLAQDATQTFDAAINGLYVTPLQKVADFECRFLQLGSPPSGILVPAKARVLAPGDEVVVVDGEARQEAVIESVGPVVAGSLTLQLTDELSGFAMLSANARVVRIDYPAAAKFVVTRMAAANIFDKLFTSQADKQESEYGKFLRGLATQALNNILAGSTVLHGQRRIAELVVQPNLIKPLMPQPGGRGEPYKIEDRGR